MRILLINNGTSGPEHPGQVEALCTKHELVTVDADKLGEFAIEDTDAVILAGSSEQGRTVADAIEDYQPQLDVISSAAVPILGIGFGFELVCYAFGAHLDKIGERTSGATVITPTDDGAKVFQGTDPIKVKETGRWLVEAEDMPKLLMILAGSETGVEAFKHKTKPIYGIQLFPDEFVYASDGKLVLENILTSFKKLAKPVPVAVVA